MFRFRDGRLAKRARSSFPAARSGRSPRFLALERLEDRTLLSYSVSNAFGLGGGDLVSRGTADDAAGDYFLAGGFSGTVNFAPAGAPKVNLTSAGGRDAFLAKYSPTGSLVWAKSYGGVFDDVANALAIDAVGNLYLAGSFNGSASFGATTLTSAGSADGFVAKLDSGGNVLWARDQGGAGYDQTSAIGLDAAGDVYTAGSFNGSATFGTTTLAGFGGYDAFVAKYTPAGAFAWAKDLGGTGSDGAAGLAVDAAGDAYATGSFQGSAAFGGITLTSAGGNDGFLAKLDPTGTVLWANSFGGTGSDLGKAVALDAAGDAVITGQFQNTATFGTTTLTSNGGSDAFVAKYTAAGALSWAQGFGGPGADSGAAVAVDAVSGAVTVAGQFSSSMTVGSGPSATTLTSNGGTDVFVSGLDPAGNFVWAKGYGGSGNDAATALTQVPDGSGNVDFTGSYLGVVAFDASILSNVGAVNIFVARLGNSTAPPPPAAVTIGLGGGDLVFRGTVADVAGELYLAGGFSGTVNLAPAGAPKVNLTSAGGRDAFLAKYSPTGSLVWAKSYGGVFDDVANALAIDAVGNLYLAGSFNGSASFGATTLTSAGSADGFVAKLDSGGNVLWARDQGGAGYDQTSAIGLDAAGDVYTAGSFNGSATFGTTTLAGFGGYDAFVAKYTPAGAFAWAKDLGGTGSDGAGGLAVDAAGDAYATGSFQGSAAFGGITLTSAGGNDGFLAKLDPTGTVLWANSFGGTGSDLGKAVALDAAGDAVITGQFQNTATFGTTTLTSNGGSDAFVAKYTAAGALSWAQGFGGPGADSGAAVAVDAVSGAVTVAGQFSSSMTVGVGASATTLTSFGGTDAFMIHLAASSTVLWAKGFGGSGNDAATAVAGVPDGTGDAVLGGSYIGPMVVGSSVLPNIGSANIFLARINKPVSPASTFAVGGFASSTTAGSAQGFSVTAEDSSGKVATTYTGTVHFASTDPSAALPADYTFTAADAGMHNFSAALKTSGAQTISATDASTITITGSQAGITVTPAATSVLIVSGFPTSVTAGASQSFAVTAKDPYGNTATGYVGTVHFTSADAHAALPADYTFTAGDAGLHDFSAALKTAGAQTITATDAATTTITGSQSGITVTPAAASVLIVSGFPTSVTAGASQSFAVTAKDPYGNTATGYAGTVHFTSADARATLPADYTFIAGNAGLHGFNAALKTAGAQTIIASDTATTTITGSQAGITVTPAAVSVLIVAGFPASSTAGASQSFSVTAKDPYGNTATGYAGTVHFTSADAHAALPADYTFFAGDAGLHGFSAALKTAGAQTINATDAATTTITGSQAGITVTPAAASVLIVAGFPTSATAGASQSFAVTADDPYGNTATGYAGTVHFTSADAHAALPADYTFIPGDAGLHGFSAALKTAGAQTITATDAATTTITGSQVGITVTPAAASVLIVAGFPPSATAGASQNFSVTARDPFGNTATGYAGTVHFTSADAHAALPADYTFIAGDAGAHGFSAALKTAGAQTITATDPATTTITGSQSGITITSAAASVLIVAGFPPSSTAGASQNFSVTARDPYGNTATGYTGTVHFTSADALAALPADYTFIAGDAGLHDFTAALKTAGAQTITATDPASSAITGSQPGITITPAAASVLWVAGFPSSATAGAAQGFAVTAKDAYGNTAAGYVGTVHFTSSDAHAVLPADYAFTAGDAGARAFSAILNTAGSQSITATDTASAGIFGSQTGITVNPAAAGSLSAAGFSAPATAGVSQTLTVTARDSSGNVATGYLGTVHFTSSDPGAALPADYTFTAADKGVHAFSAALATAGVRSITAADLVTGATGILSGILVSPAAASVLIVAGFPTSATAGASQSFAVTAKDPYGNTASGYLGTVHFTSADGHAALPADYTFIAGDAGLHGFAAALKTAGAQTITASDTATTTITGSQAGIMIRPAAASVLTVAGFPASATAGASQSFAVTAKDPYGNTAVGYVGTVHFTSADAHAALPADYTFVAGDAGLHGFTAALKTAGAQTITASDTATTTITGSQAGITIAPAAASVLIVAGFPPSAPAGASQSFGVTAKDPYGNTATGYAGTVHFTSADTHAALPADYAFIAGDAGAHGFTAAFKTAGAQTITATDAATTTITGAQSGITVTPAAASVLIVAGFPPSATAGASQSFAVTAKDPYGNTATGYAGTVHFTSADAHAALPADYTFSAGDAGTHGFSGALKTAGAQMITATDAAATTITGSQSGITITPAVASVLVVAGFPSSATAGGSQSFSVTARDTYGNTATGYTGTVHFTSADARATLPADYTFIAGDAGLHSFGAALKTAGAQTITATDAATTTIRGAQSGITVTPAAASVLVVAGFPASSTAGASQSFAVTAKDPYGNTATGYAGTVHFTSGDAQSALPADYAFIAGDAGLHSFSAALKTAGPQTITATDSAASAIAGSQSGITVTPAAASVLSVAGFPASSTAGASQSFTVTAKDPYGNTATGYAGTVHFTSGDAQSALPADYAFIAGDAGLHSFSAALKTAGAQTITVTDTATSAVAGSQSGITVTPAAASVLIVAGFPASSTAGASQSFTVTAEDPYGNTATGYVGTVHFTSADDRAALPADYTFIAGDAGTRGFTAAFKTAGAQTIIVTDTATSAVAGSQSGITVTAAAASVLIVAGFPSSATAGASQGFTVTAKDAYGNTAASFADSVHFTSSDAHATLPADYTFTPADAGARAFSAILSTVGSQSITAADMASAGIFGSQTGITVNAAAAGSLTAAGFSSPATAGDSQTLTLTARDTSGNIATGYAGTVHFTSSDPSAALPTDYTFTAADKGVHAFGAALVSAGVRSITAADLATGATGILSGIIVSPAAASALTIAGLPASTTAGASHVFTLTARDPYGNTATGYAGTIRFTTADAQAILPAEYTFTAGDAGTRSFDATLKTAGAQAITATDLASGSVSGAQSAITITPAGASVLIVAGFPASPTAGTSQTFTVTANDPYGNTAAGYTGTVHFTSGDVHASLPADYTFTAGDAGTHGFSAALKTAGPQGITAADTASDSLNGTQLGIAVAPAAASSLIVAGFPSSAIGGAAHGFTVTAIDAYGNSANGYVGTVHFTSSDARAKLPADYTLSVGDAGSRAFTATFTTAGPQSITATDTVSGNLAGTQTAIMVTPAAATTLSATGFPSSTMAGASQTFTVAARDGNGNLATGYLGTLHFTSGDPNASLPADYTFTIADKGEHTFNATMTTAGARWLAAADTVTSATATLSGITVSPAGASVLSVAGLPATTTAGIPRSFTITARDAYGNTASGYAGAVRFASTDANAMLPAAYTFTPGDKGTHTFTIALRTAGARAITAIAAGGIVHTISGITVGPAAASSFTISGFPLFGTAGAARTFVIVARDRFGNLATGYAGTVHLSSDDPQAALQADISFTAADHGTRITSAILKTAGEWSITASAGGGAVVARLQGITVRPAAASTFTVAGLPTWMQAGAPYTFTVVARDPYGNVATGYLGTVFFASRDPEAVLPAEYTFTRADNGTHTFAVAFGPRAVGDDGLVVIDVNSPGIIGKAGRIRVF